MNHSTIRGLALLALMALPLLCSDRDWGQEGAAAFEIRLPAEIRSDQVQASYVLTGPFGVFRDLVKAEPERNVYQIGTSVNHQAAESLKFILYAPGCQIVTVTVPSLSASEMNSDVPCEDLPTLEFNGRVELPEPPRRPYELEINYVAYWAQEFFDVKNGPTTIFHLTRVTPDEAGAFHVLLPNFTRDAVTLSFRRNAGLRFVARERDTGEVVSWLSPVNMERKNMGDLSIKPKFPPEVVFRPLPESTQKQMTGEAVKEGTR
jgi:hypothetical protein